MHHDLSLGVETEGNWKTLKAGTGTGTGTETETEIGNGRQMRISTCS